MAAAAAVGQAAPCRQSCWDQPQQGAEQQVQQGISPAGGNQQQQQQQQAHAVGAGPGSTAGPSSINALEDFLPRALCAVYRARGMGPL
jgi:hypothetical protein